MVNINDASIITKILKRVHDNKMKNIDTERDINTYSDGSNPTIILNNEKSKDERSNDNNQKNRIFTR